MTPRTLTDAAAAPAALTAFLRGVERRAAVFAQLHCGDVDAADNALAGAMRAFRNAAERTPVADWPRRFWGLLLATPQLRHPPPAPHWPPEFARLAALGPGPRAVLLLRLAAGLTQADAAVVLGIAQPSYRLALQRALPHHPDGSADAERWRQLGASVQQATRQLPVQRLAHLAKLREAAIQGRKLERSTLPHRRRRWGRRQDNDAPARAQRPWLIGTLWAGVVLCALGVAATYVLPLDLASRTDEPSIRIGALPPAETPAATFAGTTAMLTHRDFEWLQAAASADRALARDLDFFAWYAVHAMPHDADAVPATQAMPLADQVVGNPAMSAAYDQSETGDAPR